MAAKKATFEDNMKRLEVQKVTETTSGDVKLELFPEEDA